MFWFQLKEISLLLGIEEDFKFWSSDFLQHVKNERGNLKETACHCATESQSSGSRGCHSQEDFQENGIQDDEVLSRNVLQAIVRVTHYNSQTFCNSESEIP